tara:strand:- start:1663 stop:1875 length:213 start_codon:yes stop_codon:yes gene_type:complete
LINPNDPLAAFVIALLDDDEGINEEAFEKLMDMLSKQGEADLLWFLEEHVDATDGRFFLDSNAVKNLRVA